MSSDLSRRVQVEREQLRRLMTTYAELLGQSEEQEPALRDMTALAAVLHSFYTGVENILKRIAIEIDGHLPQGDAWHRELLAEMAIATERRPAAISQATHAALRDYLLFRHFFRHAYAFHLDWDRMSGLVLGCGEALVALERDLDLFFDEIGNAG